jgi:hypothetical protein
LIKSPWDEIGFFDLVDARAGARRTRTVTAPTNEADLRTVDLFALDFAGGARIWICQIRPEMPMTAPSF